MQQVITVELDTQLIKDVETGIEKSSFRNRTHLIEYLLQRFAYENRFVKHKELIYYLTTLLGLALLCILIVAR